MEIVTEDPQGAYSWLESKLGYKLHEPACGYYITVKGLTEAAVVFSEYKGFDAHINLAGRKALSRMALRINANIAFNSLGCRRLSGLTRDTSVMWALMERLGFEEEGRLREYYPDKEDAILWGMLKEECRWF